MLGIFITLQHGREWKGVLKQAVGDIKCRRLLQTATTALACDGRQGTLGASLGDVKLLVMPGEFSQARCA